VLGLSTGDALHHSLTLYGSHLTCLKVDPRLLFYRPLGRSFGAFGKHFSLLAFVCPKVGNLGGILIYMFCLVLTFFVLYYFLSAPSSGIWISGCI
jgi:hypothetical protein